MFIGLSDSEVCMPLNSVFGVTVEMRISVLWLEANEVRPQRWRALTLFSSS